MKPGVGGDGDAAAGGVRNLLERDVVVADMRADGAPRLQAKLLRGLHREPGRRIKWGEST